MLEKALLAPVNMIPRFASDSGIKVRDHGGINILETELKFLDSFLCIIFFNFIFLVFFCFLSPIHTADETKLFCRVGVGGVYMNSRRLPTDLAMRMHNAAVGRDPIYNNLQPMA